MRTALRVATLLAMALRARRRAHADDVEYAGPKYDTEALAITVSSIQMSDDRLVFKLMFWNHTDKLMLIDRDKMTVKLPDGTTRARYKGMMVGFGFTPGTHQIAPKGNHAVWVEFVVAPPPHNASPPPPGPLAHG